MPNDKNPPPGDTTEHLPPNPGRRKQRSPGATRELLPPRLGAGRRIALAAALGALLALAAFLLIDRWLVRPARVELSWGGIDHKAADALTEDARVARARMTADALADLVEAYRITHGRHPDAIDALAARQPGGEPPLCEPKQVVDPWGKKYRIKPEGDRARVWTTSPDGKEISSR